MDKPIQQTIIDLKELREICQEYLDFIDDDEIFNEDGHDDYATSISEKAMELIYGKKVWDYINNRQ